MPRKPRVYSITDIYHVVLRSVNKQLIFLEDNDYFKLLFMLSDYKIKYQIDIYAYCIMTNHVHLLLKASRTSLSGFFQSFESDFARWYNTKYERTGHLFQDRFHSFPIEDDDYYLTTLAYIHNNPVKAGMCRCPSEYHWSSYNAYFGEKTAIVNSQFTFRLVGSKKAVQRFLVENTSVNTFMNKPSRSDYQSTPRITDEKAITEYVAILGTDSPFKAQRLSVSERKKIIVLLRERKLSYSQIARVTGISKSTLYRMMKKDKAGAPEQAKPGE